jgi:hypothetical protein
MVRTPLACFVQAALLDRASRARSSRESPATVTGNPSAIVSLTKRRRSRIVAMLCFQPGAYIFA